MSNCNLLRKQSSVKSGSPDFEYNIGKDLYGEIANEIFNDGIDYTEKEIPDVMTCAGVHPSDRMIDIYIY